MVLVSTNAIVGYSLFSAIIGLAVLYVGVKAGCDQTKPPNTLFLFFRRWPLFTILTLLLIPVFVIILSLTAYDSNLFDECSGVIASENLDLIDLFTELSIYFIILLIATPTLAFLQTYAMLKENQKLYDKLPIQYGGIFFKTVTYMLSLTLVLILIILDTSTGAQVCVDGVEELGYFVISIVVLLSWILSFNPIVQSVIIFFFVHLSIAPLSSFRFLLKAVQTLSFILGFALLGYSIGEFGFIFIPVAILFFVLPSLIWLRGASILRESEIKDFDLENFYRTYERVGIMEYRIESEKAIKPYLAADYWTMFFNCSRISGPCLKFVPNGTQQEDNLTVQYFNTQTYAPTWPAIACLALILECCCRFGERRCQEPEYLCADVEDCYHGHDFATKPKRQHSLLLLPPLGRTIEYLKGVEAKKIFVFDETAVEYYRIFRKYEGFGETEIYLNKTGEQFMNEYYRLYPKKWEDGVLDEKFPNGEIFVIYGREEFCLSMRQKAKQRNIETVDVVTSKGLLQRKQIVSLCGCCK